MTARLYPTGPLPRAQFSPFRPGRVIAALVVTIAATLSFGMGWSAGAATPERLPETLPTSPATDAPSDQGEQRECAWGHESPDGSCTAWIVHDPQSGRWWAEIWMGTQPPQVGGGPWWAVQDLTPAEAREQIEGPR